MKKKIQILLVHGGMTFKNKKDYLRYLKTRKISLKKKITWSGDYLDKKLGRNFELIRPRMPLPDDAKYDDWKIYFKRHIPYLRNNLILIGHSLGGIFLAKYLSENKFPKKILATILVAAPYGGKNKNANYTLGDFSLPKNLTKFQKQGGKIFICHSKDDPVVPFVDADKYKKALPEAKMVVFKNREHFNQESFPEIIKMIKNDVKPPTRWR